MKKNAAQLAVFALEQIGVRFTFGIPGVHNTELYDELNKSQQIEPILVTHEMNATFMGDAVSRTTDSIGCAMIVPAAGTTHGMSGIGEAFLDGIPMLVISGGIRRDSGRHFQLHAIDQTQLVAAVTKGAFVIQKHDEVIPTIYKAYDLATSGTPGPVFIEIPADLQLFQGEVAAMPEYQPRKRMGLVDSRKIAAMIELLRVSKKPGIYLGWGAAGAASLAIELADALGAPVATTLQGLSVFPADHPLHTGMGIGRYAVPAADLAFEGVDCLVTVGARFSELATGSYSIRVPENHIHIDVNREVFDKNYPAKVSLAADARDALFALVAAVQSAKITPRADVDALKKLIAEEKRKYFAEWNRSATAPGVGPGPFFQILRKKLKRDAFLTVDDGNHTFLSEELFPVYEPKRFISPTDFNAMGYCVPAAIAVQAANPESQVVGIVGDGAFLMTGLELLTASTQQLGVVICVFHDGELGQISQFQKIPLNRKTCTVIGDIRVEGVALATGAAYLEMKTDADIERILDQALALAAQHQPVVIDVRIDYSQKTRFTTGVVKANLSRFPLREKLRFISRALKRHVLG